MSSRLVDVVMRKGGIATVYLNRPTKFNGLSLPMFRAIEETALSLKENPDVRAVRLFFILCHVNPFTSSLIKYRSFLREEVEYSVRVSTFPP